MDDVIVTKIEKDFTISADLSREEYSKSIPVTEFNYPWEGFNRLRQQSEARLLYSNTGLYLRFVAEDTYITAKHTEPKSKVYLDDCLEIFVWPDQSIHRYFGYEVNSIGVMLDYYRDFDIEGDSGFTYDWISGALTAASIIPDSGWCVEFYIPFQSLNVPAPTKGNIWKVGLNRIDISESGETSYASFSDLPSDVVSFHNPYRFKNLRFD